MLASEKMASNGIGAGKKDLFLRPVHHQGRNVLDSQVLESRGIFFYLNMMYIDLHIVKLFADLGAVLTIGAVEQNVFCIPRERRPACGKDEIKEAQNRKKRAESRDDLALAGENTESTEYDKDTEDSQAEDTNHIEAKELVSHEKTFTCQRYHKKEVDDPFASHVHRPHLLYREDGDKGERAEAKQDHREVAEPRILRYYLAPLGCTDALSDNLQSDLDEQGECA